MRVIFMDEARCDKPVVLISPMNNVWVHDHFPHNFFLVESVETCYCSNTDNDVRNVHNEVFRHNDTK